MKIQINSLEALERLLGEDTEIQFEIRTNIAQEFTRKHLKTLLTESIKEAFEDKKQSLQWNIRYEVEQQVSKMKGEILKGKVAEELKAQINTDLKYFVDSEVYKLAIERGKKDFSAYAENILLEAKQKLVNRANNFLTQEFIPSIVQPLIDNAVNLTKQNKQ